MPNGFRGRAAESILSAAGSAMNEATAAHNQRPLTPQPGAQPPSMPNTPNERIPHEASSAHSGGNITGVGNSSNIVVGSAEYNNILSRIDRIDDNMGRTLHQVATRVEELCRGSFVLPRTVRRSNIITADLKNALSEYRAMTADSLTEIRRFTDSMLSI